MAANTELTSYMQKYMDSKDSESKKTFGDIEEIEDDVERKYNAFTNFARISHPPSDHHYLDRKGLFSFIKPSFRRRIEQEWSLLEEYLMQSVFVRVYDDRIDLMRAAVMGPKDTPYHHCLFFFDIYFPPSYPYKPPKFHYHSYGLDLNPHLHVDGKVSILLLENQVQPINYCCLQNRSFNFVEERWNPNESNILNVFDAILSLCVSVNPTLKQYGVEGTVFVMVCEKMIRLLTEPPMNFEDFVVGHLRKRAHYLLLKFKEKVYKSEEMLNLFATLMEVFEKTTGAYCKHHLDFLRSRKLQDSEV